MKTWHYATSSGSSATVTEDQLADLIEAATIRKETLVWSDGMSDWKAAGEAMAERFETPSSQLAPPPVPDHSGPQRSHEVDFEIIGDDMQMVEVELDPDETVIAEAGMMNYMDDGIAFETKMGDGSEPDQGFMGKLMSAGKRAITGESLFLTHFSNNGSGKKRVSFAAPPIPARSFRWISAITTGKFSARKTPFSVRPSEPILESPSTKNWGRDFLAGKALFCSVCGATVWLLSMPAAPSCAKS